MKALPCGHPDSLADEFGECRLCSLEGIVKAIQEELAEMSKKLRGGT